MKLTEDTHKALSNAPSVANDYFMKPIIRKWEATGLLAGINDEYRRRVTALLLENQAQDLERMDEETRAFMVGPYTKFIFPTVRRSWPQLVAYNLVSIQPMTSPVGAVFFWRYRYGSSKGPTVAGTEMIANFDKNYSSEDVIGELLMVAGGGGGNTGAHTCNFIPLKPGTIRVFMGAVLVATDVNGVLTAIAGGPDIGGAPAINYAAGTNAGITIGAAPFTGDVTMSYRYDSELNPNIGQVNIDVQRVPIEAETRKLKSLWSAEAAEDLRALHGGDIEAELVAGVANEISLEVDRMILSDLLLAAETPGIEGCPFPPSTSVFDAQPPAGTVARDHLWAFIVAMNKVANDIHKKTLRGAANWAVTSPDVASLLDSTPFFTPDASQSVYSGAIVKVGAVQSRYTCYKDPLFPRNKMLMGFLGPTFLDSGYIFAPYIPLQVTPTFLDPNNFELRKALRTRYGRRLVRAEFYGTVSVVNIDKATRAAEPILISQVQQQNP
jgi:hypothetical protein